MKLHARVTRVIEITDEQAKRLDQYTRGLIEADQIQDIKDQFVEGIDNDGWEAGYIPRDWLCYDGCQAGIALDSLDYEDIDL